MSESFWFKPEHDGVRKTPSEKAPDLMIQVHAATAAAALAFVINRYPVGRGGMIRADAALDLVIQGLRSQGLVTTDEAGRWIPTAKGILQHASSAR